MQHINEIGKTHRVNRAVCVPIMVGYDLQNACTTKTLQRFGYRMLLALLCPIERNPYIVPNFLRKGP